VGVAPQWIGEQIPNNNNGCLEEEPEEEEEEEENEAMEDDDEDDAEVINPYEEADPHNRPPPASDEETEFALPVVQIVDVDNIPIPPVVQFGNFYVGESSSSKDLLEGNDKVCVPGPMPYDLRSVHRGVKSLRFQEEPSIHIAPVPHADDPYVMVRDVARGTRRDEDFHGTEGAVGHVRWFEKVENTFEISECAEVRKVKFATATLYGRALTWWNSQVATLGHEVANARSWAEIKQMMT
nr:putative reverse transcriptase domain-containing protein [Tanacetum cinerariifolium]